MCPVNSIQLMPESTIIKALEQYRLRNLETPIVVEGKNDVECLRNLNFEGEIIILNSGETLVNFCDSLAEKHDKIIILTDFDRKGIELKKTMQIYLNGIGCQVDAELWKILRRYANIRTIEELPFAVDRAIESADEKIKRKEVSLTKWNFAKERK